MLLLRSITTHNLLTYLVPPSLILLATRSLILRYGKGVQGWSPQLSLGEITLKPDLPPFYSRMPDRPLTLSDPIATRCSEIIKGQAASFPTVAKNSQHHGTVQMHFLV